jgi:hypothetical protein
MEGYLRNVERVLQLLSAGVNLPWPLARWRYTVP